MCIFFFLPIQSDEEYVATARLAVTPDANYEVLLGRARQVLLSKGATFVSVELACNDDDSVFSGQFDRVSLQSRYSCFPFVFF